MRHGGSRICLFDRRCVERSVSMCGAVVGPMPARVTGRTDVVRCMGHASRQRLVTLSVTLPRDEHMIHPCHICFHDDGHYMHPTTDNVNIM